MQDNVVATMYTGIGPEQKMAQDVLTTLKEHPDSWTKVMNQSRLQKSVT
jgi:exportin-1